MIKHLNKLVFIALLSLLPAQSMAWGAIGHRIVGQIADSYLNPKARLALKKILGNESLAMASTWADFIKSDPSYSYLSPWHYVDLKAGINDADAKAYFEQDTIADAYTKLNFIIKELKKKSLAADKKLMYTRLLIHIVGDIHQPFHVGRGEDAGGNKIMVQWAGEPNPTNLHSVWDSKLIESQQYSYTEYAHNINFTTAKQRAAWQSGSLTDWLIESHGIAETLYAEIKEPNQKLGYRYVFDHIHLAEQQMLKGGVRLAGLLNQIFGQ